MAKDMSIIGTIFGKGKKGGELEHNEGLVPEYIKGKTRERMKMTYIPLDEIRPNPMQPRQTFRNIEELAESIRDKKTMTPIHVEQLQDGTYQIVWGERRFRAYELLREKYGEEYSRIPAVVDFTERSDHERLILAIVENMHREDLYPEEVGVKLVEYLNDPANIGITLKDIAQQLGKSLSTVSNLVSIGNMYLQPENVVLREKTKEIRENGHDISQVALRELSRQLPEVIRVVAEKLPTDRDITIGLISKMIEQEGGQEGGSSESFSPPVKSEPTKEKKDTQQPPEKVIRKLNAIKRLVKGLRTIQDTSSINNPQIIKKLKKTRTEIDALTNEIDRLIESLEQG